MILLAKLFVCGYYGVTWEDVISPSRYQGPTDARHTYCYLMRTYTTLTVVEIAKSINRYHSTVITGSRRIKGLLTVKDDIIIPAIDQFTHLIRKSEHG